MARMLMMISLCMEEVIFGCISINLDNEEDVRKGQCKLEGH